MQILSPTASKYLFKYLTKGEDRAMVHAEVNAEETVKDEIKEFIDLRSVGSSGLLGISSNSTYLKTNQLCML